MRNIRGSKLSMIIILFMMVFLGILSYFINSPKQTNMDNRGRAAQSVELTLVPDKTNLILNDVVTVAVHLNTAEKLAQGADLIINYDSTVFQAATTSGYTQVGPFFTNAQISMNAVINNQVRFGVFTQAGAMAQSGEGVIAFIKFKVINGAPKQTTLSFDQSNTLVDGILPDGSSNNILESALPVTLNIVSPTPTPTITPSPTVTPSPSPSPSPTVTPSPTITPTPTASPTPTVTPSPTLTPSPTITPTPTPLAVQIKVKFDGITDARTGTSLTAIFKQGTVEVVRRTINMTGNSSGIYTGTVNNVQPGVYDIYLKGWAHVSKKIMAFNLSSINITVDVSQSPLIGGDIVCLNPCSDQVLLDNIINILDLGKVLKDYDPIPSVPTTSLADINLDGKVNVLDLGMILKNYGVIGQ
jgi:hypothetical protein